MIVRIELDPNDPDDVKRLQTLFYGSSTPADILTDPGCDFAVAPVPAKPPEGEPAKLTPGEPANPAPGMPSAATLAAVEAQAETDVAADPPKKKRKRRTKAQIEADKAAAAASTSTDTPADADSDAKPAPTLEDVSEAFKRASAMNGEAVGKWLKGFLDDCGVANVRDLKKSSYPEIVKWLTDFVDGEPAPSQNDFFAGV